MPGLDFTLPHWLYWVGLIVFPIIAMVLSRRPRPRAHFYSLPLAYMILVTGGFLGLHRFYLKNLWGLVYIPLFVFVLFANGAERDARATLSDAANNLRQAERTLARQTERLESAQRDIPALEEEIAAADPESFARRGAERRLERARDGVTRSEERIAEAQAEIETATPARAAAAEERAFWNDAAKYAFYAIAALMLIDALLLPRLLADANDGLAFDADPHGSDATRPAEEAGSDASRVRNPIDRLSLLAGEFVSYWAVIAVFVYYYEVIARYVFNSPTNWAHEAMYLMFGMQYLIAGSYAMLSESHVRVDIFYAPMSVRGKAFVDILTSIFFFIFAGTLLWTSWTFAMDALAVPTGNALISDWARGQIGFGEMLTSLDQAQWADDNIRWGEISFNEWEVPLWPMKWVMVIGGLLLVLQGVSKLGKDVLALVRGV